MATKQLWQAGFYKHYGAHVFDASEEEIRAACELWGWKLVEQVDPQFGWTSALVEVDEKTEARLQGGETIELEHSSGLVATIELP